MKEQTPLAPGAPRAFYDALATRELHPHIVRGIRYRNLVIAGSIPAAATRILEIGPGEGWLCGLLTGRGHEVYASDLSGVWVSRLPAGSTAGRVAAMMTALPFRAASFDTVVAAEVMEHIPEIDAAAAEAARVLKPGGRFIVTVPYRESLRLITCPSCRHEFDENGHVHEFDERRLEGVMKSCGLRPVQRFIGPTRFSREILRRAPIRPMLRVLQAMDRLMYRTQRVSDTWMLMTAEKPGGGS